MNFTEGGIRIVEGRTKNPLATIITVVRNGGTAIEQTIQSVVRHQCDEMEYIVVDGNSTDATLACIKSYESAIDYWISEPDKGIYDAIEKGMKASKGLYCLVINLGDLLLELPLKELRDLKNAEGDVGMFIVQMSNGKVHESKIDYRTKFANTLHHQGCFYRREIALKYNFQAYPHFADFDLNQKLLIAKQKFVRYHRTISYFSVDGVSSLAIHRNEYYRVVRDNFGKWWELVARTYIAQGNMKKHIRSLRNRWFG
jgi:glycosyltransferase involved in cell wall biosynthesis